ncbi:MAG: Type II secretion system protein E [candidate division TA06 bacterium 32_111]|uniref:Type II secretion system protein E n=2 Tax=Bacteria candidate phyla TaxID=1783234 RepID=A0A117M693_UNCT6|nr:MAG: Type II secretion system protein E [candidate division TA06 bacterium 32_111]KUK86667.1 MAG: Type II secretion system protein E [candidate division TA06 bacterium 34_109]HCP16596.1 type IV-A pilus assembly ATPase PilB [candidate division WOR-3 bacterium]
MWKRLGDLLIDEGLITKDQLNQALSQQKENGGRLGTILVQMGFVTDDQISKALGKQYNVGVFEFKEDIDPLILKIVSPQIAQKFQVIPVKREGKNLYLAMANPVDVYTIEDIKFATGYNVVPLVASENMISKAIEKYYGVAGSMAEVLSEIGMEEEIEILEEEKQPDAQQLLIDVDAAPVVKLVNGIIVEAVKQGASDIHIEPFDKILRVRYRVDGELKEVMSPQYTLGPAIVSRLKIMAGLNISERRVPQDGRIGMKVGEKSIDLRVSTLPTAHGEKICMRIAEKSSLMKLEDIGLSKKAYNDFVEAISRPNGIILVTGPTGSGKTVTLYSILARLNTPNVNITTAEDPIEYDFVGINQVNVRENIGYTFATALKAFLRQDPDIIMVGEIRDLETGDIAIKAALTGHLVLSTLHTNDTVATIARLEDMGIEPYKVASSVVLIEAQRLIRRVCKNCAVPIEIPDEEFIRYGINPEYMRGGKFMMGKGCPVCGFSGYKGRVGIFEVLPITPTISEMIVKEASIEQIRMQARKEGVIMLREDGLIKVKAGITTLEEVVQATVG